ncbi:MAG: serine/threonine-protein kinase [Marmoricola sp.]
MSDVDRTLVGRYDLEHLVGSGGTADVYQASDRVLGRKVAVKVLRSTSTSDADRARFAAEARLLASLNHPGLVTVLDAGIHHGCPFLVMELIEGPTLGQLIADGGAIDQSRVSAAGVQLAGALAYAHARGVVHRDVKPGNILCTDDSVVLTDFGIARIVADATHHTRTGETIGSPAYLSPEQVSGDPLTTAVDVYSLGLVLLEALTGQRAYAGSPIEAAVARLTAAPDIPISLGARWTRLLTAMTQLDPARRPTAADVVVELGGTAPVVPAAATATMATAVIADPVPTAVLTGLAAVPPADHAPVSRRPALSWLAGAGAAAIALALGLTLVTAGATAVTGAADGALVVPTPAKQAVVPTTTLTAAPTAVRAPVKAPVHRTHQPPKPHSAPKKAPKKGHGKHGRH